MKRLIILVASIILASDLYANIPKYDVYWLLEEEEVYVTTNPNALLYKTCYYGKEVYDGWIGLAISDSRKPDRYRSTISYTRYKTKSLRKPQIIKVRGYANLKEQIEYDTYVVEFKNVLYYLPAKYVKDNNPINTHNNALVKSYTDMFTEMDDLAKERDSLRLHYLEISIEQQEYFRNLTITLPSKIDSVQNVIEAEFANNKIAEFDKWHNSLPKSTKNIYDNVLSLESASLHSQNSAGGCDCSVYFTNKSNKTIKYLYWTGTFYNAVNDPVYCDIRGISTFTGQDTGPYAPNETGGGTWDCVIYDWAADYVKLSNIRIVYTNGTSTSIGEADIKRLLSYNDIYERIASYGSEYGAIENAIKPYKRQLSNAETELALWSSRVYWLKEPPVSAAGYESNYYTPMKNEKGEYKVLFDRLYSIYHRRDALKRRISEFEERNFIKVD